MKKFQKRIDYVRFWDHAYGNYEDRAPLKCEVVGFVIEEDPLTVYLASWVTNNEADNHNNEVFSILKSTIIDRKTIKKF